MADYMTVKEAAKEWGITDRQVSGMCLSGRIQCGEACRSTH